MKTLNIILATTLLGFSGFSVAQDAGTLPLGKKEQSKSIIAKDSSYQQSFNKALAAYLKKDYAQTVKEGIDALQYDPNGDLHAMLGESFYQLGLQGTTEVHKNHLIKARALMEKVVMTKKEHKVANNILGNIYSSGLGVAVDHKKAYNYFRTNAEQDSAIDTFNAGQAAHSMGDLKQAFRWYERALQLAKDQDTPEDHLFIETTFKNMAFIFYGEDKSFYEKRIPYLKEYAKYPYRSGRFLMEIALEFLNGKDVPKSQETFFKMLKTVADDKASPQMNYQYRLAARAALVEAYLSKEFKNDMEAFNYAYVTERPDVIGLVAGTDTFKRFQAASKKVAEQDIADGKKLMQDEAAKGNQVAKSVLALLDLGGYEGGLKKEDMVAAANTLKEAVYRGDYIGLDTLIMAYLTGESVDKDVELAKELMALRKSDSSIPLDEEGSNRMAFLDAMSDYFTDKKKQAFDKLKVLADKGVVEALENIGLLYAQEGNYQEAEKYMNLLAEKRLSVSK